MRTSLRLLLRFQTSDILSPAPLVKVVADACEAMQPEVNSIFNTLHSEMSCFAHLGISQDSAPASPVAPGAAGAQRPRTRSQSPSFSSSEAADSSAGVEPRRRSSRRDILSSLPAAPHAQYARERQGIMDDSEEDGARPSGAQRVEGVEPRGVAAYVYSSGLRRGSDASDAERGAAIGLGRRGEEEDSSFLEEAGQTVSEHLRRRLTVERRREELHARRREAAERAEDGGEETMERSRRRENDEELLSSPRENGEPGAPPDTASVDRNSESQTLASSSVAASSPSIGCRHDSHAVVFTSVAAHPLSGGSSPLSGSARTEAPHAAATLRVCVEKREEEDEALVAAVGCVEEKESFDEEGSGCELQLPEEQEQMLNPNSLRSEQTTRYNFPAFSRAQSGRTSWNPSPWERRSPEGTFGSEDGASALLPSYPPSAKTVLLRELTTALVTSGSFDARVQFMLQVFAVDLLHLNPLILIRLEHHLAADLLDLLRASTKEGARQKTWRRLKIAGAAIGGGVLVALTAGLAAPGIVAGIASLGLGGAGVSAFLASAGGMAVIVSLFGAGGAGLTGWKYSRRIANIKIFEFDMLNGKTPSSLGVTVCVSGYLRTFDDIALPWLQGCPHACSDLLALKWEPNILKSLGGMVVQMLSQDFAVAAGKYYLQHTALGGLTFALFWPMALIQYAASLDNTWSLCRERAQQAGRLLADAISDTQAVGQRPVSLVGYSMGARVIFYCLQTLWKRRKLHVVCDCVLIGLPASLNTKQWSAARDVVSRRLINVYSRSDWLLAFLYRWMEWGLQVAGLGPVKNVPGVENYDVTGLVKSHAQYPEMMPDILAFIGFDA
uniref:Putative transmembrane protein n=1 Tax=Toxoplasma gondii COUG TaxID=1074873 RepID=A0A2G8XY29_TOXGO|nr:putative transmembrane protein [Toxoplasma gondii COUG]